LSLREQFFAFLLSIALGYGAGCGWDFYRAVRAGLRLGRWGTGLGDILFWVALTAAVFGFLLLVTWGEMRWYVFLGLGLGAALYRATLSPRGYAFWYRGTQRSLKIFRRLGRKKRRNVEET
jgi:spore cortex biosynthesis protein YabQ